MKHTDCVNYISVNAETGICARTRKKLAHNGIGSVACQNFEAYAKCGNCEHFTAYNQEEFGKCNGFGTSNWAHASCGAFCCENYICSQANKKGQQCVL